MTGAQVGSAVHELMQRMPLEEEITLDTLRQALEQVQAEPAVKARIKLEAILAFYETPLGALLQKEAPRVRARSSLCHAEERSSQWRGLRRAGDLGWLLGARRSDPAL